MTLRNVDLRFRPFHVHIAETPSGWFEILIGPMRGYDNSNFRAMDVRMPNKATIKATFSGIRFVTQDVDSIVKAGSFAIRITSQCERIYKIEITAKGQAVLDSVECPEENWVEIKAWTSRQKKGSANQEEERSKYIAAFGLRPKEAAALRREGINLVGEALDRGKRNLRIIKNVGKKTVGKIAYHAWLHGLPFPD